jgi:HPt (histidine-containing phosphotransfer) domain-containing protein
MMPIEMPLDKELLEENASLGLEDLHELIELYLAQADDIMGELRTAVQTGAANEVDELAHKLAGSSAVVGVQAMVEPLRMLEKQAHAGILANSNRLLDETAERLDLCRRLLNEYMAEKGWRDP